MSVKLTTELTKQLLEQPESGMGYQIVDVETRNKYLTKEAIVFNSEYLIYDEEKKIEHLSEVEKFDEIMKSASISTDIIGLKVKSKYKIEKQTMLRESTESYLTEMSTKIGEIFKRFSAFKNDRRINTDGSLKPGTYATTEEDAKNVRTGLEAVRRYALPNPKPAIYVFTIKPPEKTEIKKGKVQPKYNQPGGGIEVIFVKGSPSRTVTGPDIIQER